MGYAFGFTTRLMLRVMRRFGVGRDQEVALTLAMAYLAYWVTASPGKGSGVVAVAVMGLYGAATNKWCAEARDIGLPPSRLSLDSGLGYAVTLLTVCAPFMPPLCVLVRFTQGHIRQGGARGHL